MSNAVLAVDLGKTRCRASLRAGGGEKDSAEGPGAPGLASADGVGAAVRAIEGVLGEIDGAATDFVLSVGAAGAASAPEARDELARRLAGMRRVAGVAVTSDAVTAHAGALGGTPGVVLAAGTGAVVTAVDGAGVFTRVDGWGPLLGDEGSGGWIGVEGLRAALRSHDGRGPDTALAVAAAERYGPLDALPRLFGQHENPALLAAEFAPAVAACAESDETAADIMGAAGHALARAVLAAIKTSGLPTPAPYAVTGGLIELGAALSTPLNRALAGVVEPRAARGRPIDGAALLGTDTTTALEPLITRIV
ncbi:N-acetylglucosamine kinase-like BadF-type ATPase [Nocardia transvalensis]|uniref:N-acetylglucosamine kinase-like BadF-type ATPase n=1 Tax=Nocardia transvalensis TaxID=37333 RepID=A0A7W9PA22_9NOCA|nr:BadF/BadG/BcrA/BcrD ATPase family protein [Nocardia transvalensis]MBB5911894.1 N-acetylglucosamine kinase-like BadF-type ATPase [Nocardia transvalensis]